MEGKPKRTPLYERHQRAGARMVTFGGYEMPVHYGSIINEVLAVRRGVGIFDVSHMGRLFFSGSSAQKDLDRLVTLNISTLSFGQVRYGFLCRDDGGILDDLTAFRLNEDQFLLVVNAATREKDVQHLVTYLSPQTHLHDQTEETFMIAVQGPDSLPLVDDLTHDATKPSRLRRFQGGLFSIAGVSVWVTRTGYTGEDGVEIVGPKEGAQCIWDQFLSAGAVPCGLGARDILRLEAGFCLYGQDLTEEITPLEADLMRFVDLAKDFIGKESLVRRMEQGPKIKRVGLRLSSRSAPRPHSPVTDGHNQIGFVTSGSFSPHLNSSIGMAYLQAEKSHTGQDVWVLIRDQPVAAQVVAMPFLPLPSRKSS